MSRKRVFRHREGQSMVETALLLPIMLTLTMGVMDVAFAFFAYVQVINAAREGARSAAQYEYIYQSGATTYTYADNDCNRGYGTGVDPPYTQNAQAAAVGELGSMAAVDAGQFAQGSCAAPGDVVVTYPDALDATNNPGREGQAVKVTVTYRYRLPVSSTLGIPTPSVSLSATNSQMIRRK